VRPALRMSGIALAGALALASPPDPALAQARTVAKPVTHLVGPTRLLKRPSDAARVVRDGDIVEIDPGTYRDCAVWRASNLTLRGHEGIAHIADKTCQGKALWVIDGDNTTVERIRFTGAAVPDKNGAGIRVTGGSLTVRDSAFEDNENGILTGRAPGKAVTIERSHFERNGKCDPDCAHGIYIGAIERLIVRGSTFRDQRVGHHIKSRARDTSVLDSTIDDGKDGTASYLIDLPNGGNALIARNKLRKGRLAQNTGTAIAYGSEGTLHPATALRIEDNEFRSDLPTVTDFVGNRTTYRAHLSGNSLCGKVNPLSGPGEVRNSRPCKD